MDKEHRREQKREYDRAWRAAHPEEARERARIKARLRRQRYREKMRAYDRARYEVQRGKVRARRAQQYAQNIGGVRDKLIAYARARYLKGNIRDRLRCAVNAARARAKTRGIPFNLTITDLGEPTHCAVTGIKFVMTAGQLKGNIFVPSLDRIDPELGYVRDNVRVVVHGYNLAKYNGTDADVLKLARALVKAFPE